MVPARPIARVLVVEDSMIIAMDTEDNLRELGVAEVVVASSVDMAWRRSPAAGSIWRCSISTWAANRATRWPSGWPI